MNPERELAKLLESYERGRITDRLKDMFITGGFNCYPAEIENLLIDPSTGRADWVVIEGSFGLGESVVSGRVSDRKSVV